MLELFRFFVTKFLYFALHLDTGSFPRPLTGKEEQDAFFAMAAGNKTARDKLIRHNLRLVAHIAKKYYAAPGDQEDLISIGIIGLIKAVDTFDYQRKARFSTYASKCIENEIRMHLRRLRRDPDAVSLQDPIETGKDGAALQIEDAIPDAVCMENTCEQREMAESLRCGIERLEGRERQIILLRYGLAGQPPQTQQQVAEILHISRSYVSRLETKALEQLHSILGEDAV